MQTAHLCRRRPLAAAASATLYSASWRATPAAASAASLLSCGRTSACAAASAGRSARPGLGRSLHHRAAWMHQQQSPPPVQDRQGHSHIESMHEKRDRNIQAAAAATPSSDSAAVRDTSAGMGSDDAPSPVASPVSAAAPADAPADAAPAKGVRYYASKIKAMLQHYTLGAKLLWKNSKKAREIRKKIRSGSVASYSDRAFLNRSRTDLSLGVPFVLVFAVPVVGYAAPLFALLAPRYVPSTFHTPAQAIQHLRADARAARASVASLQHVLAYHSHACGLEKLRDLLERIERGVGRVQHINELLPLSGLFEQLTPSPLLFPRAHLLLLHRALRHSSFVPRYLFPKKMIVRSLDNWRQRVWEEDQLLESGGVADLSVAELVSALYDRGIYRQPIAMGGVLARHQTSELASVDKHHNTPRPVDPALLLPEPPSEALIDEWRSTLSEWVQLHARLQQQLDEANHAHTKQLQEQQERERKQKETAVDPGSPTPAAKVASISPPASSSAGAKKSVAPSFPLAFFIHAGPLSRVPSTAVDLAAVTPVHKP